MIHRVGRVRFGGIALVTGAAGGVGTAALQLLRLAGVKRYGAASAPKHDILRALGAIPINYRAGPVDRLTRALEPDGVDYVFDAIGGANISKCIGALRRGGTLVGFGFMGAPGLISQLAMFANIFVGARLRGRQGNSRAGGGEEDRSAGQPHVPAPGSEESPRTSCHRFGRRQDRTYYLKTAVT